VEECKPLDDGEFRSEKAAKAIVTKLGYSQVKVIEGGIDALLEAFPLTKAVWPSNVHDFLLVVYLCTFAYV
jgi:hypothetical protein